MDVITNNVRPLHAKYWDLFSCVGTFLLDCPNCAFPLFYTFLYNFSIYQYSLSMYIFNIPI